MRLRLIAIAIVVITVLGGAFVGRDLLSDGSGGGWSHEAGDAWTAERGLLATFERGKPNVVLVVEARTGTVDDPAVETAALAFIAELEGRPDLTDVESYWSLGRPDWLRSEDDASALITARVPGNTASYARRADGLAGVVRDAGDAISVRMGGEVIVHGDIQNSLNALLVPFLVVALVSLALVFWFCRKWVAVALIAATSALAVALTLLALFGVSQLREVPVLSVLLGMMSAWALASASAYLMLSRYMSERRSGAGRRDAVVATIGTAGRTVAIAAAVSAAMGMALWVLPTALLRSTGYALGLAGVMAGISSIVVLGLLLAVVGVRVLADAELETAPPPPKSAGRVARQVYGRPLAVGLVLFVLLAPLLPLGFGVATGEPGSESLSGDVPSREVAATISRSFVSDEVNAPLVVSPSVVDFSSADELTAEYAATLSKIGGIARVDSDQGSFVDGEPVNTPDEVIARYTGDQGTWLLAPVATGLPASVAESAVGEIAATAAPFRVVVGGAEARQVATSEAVAARAPIFAGLAVLLAVALVAWLLRSLSAALRVVVSILLTTAGAAVVVRWGFAEGLLAGPLGFPDDAVAAVAPSIAWVLSAGIAGAATIFGWGAIREMFDLTTDRELAAPRALALTAGEHLHATLFLTLPFLPLLLGGWSTAKLLGAAALVTGLVMVTLGRHVALPAAAAISGRLWPVDAENTARRVYPATAAGRMAVTRAEEAEKAVAELAAETAEVRPRELAAPTEHVAEPSGAAPVQKAAPVGSVVGSVEEDPVPSAAERAAQAAAAAEAERVAAERAAAEKAAAAEAERAAAERAAAELAEREAAERAAAERAAIEQAEREAAEKAAIAEAERVAEERAAAERAAAIAAEEAAALAAAEKAAAEKAAAEKAAAEKAAAEKAELAAAERAAAEKTAADRDDAEAAGGDQPAAVAVVAGGGGSAEALAKPSTAGTVDVARLTESVIAALDENMQFTTELNSAFVANPANNLSRVMEAILRDASQRGGEEVLVYGHASANRYRWMVVDSGPRAETDPTRARTLAEAQRFIRRVGGVVECRPEGDFTVFVVEIPMAS